MRRFWKRYGLALAACIGLSIWTIGTCCITGAIVHHNTVIEVTEQIERENEEKAKAQQGARIITGEESLQKAIEADAKWLGRVGQGVLNTYKSADLDDARKLMLCVLCRVYSPGEFGEFQNIQSIEDAAMQNDQWFGFKDNLVYEESVENIALEVSSMFHKGKAMPCSLDMCYAGWNGDEIVLRNHWEDNSKARHY